MRRKNIRSVGGKPLIYWSITAAQKSSLLQTFYVSTENQEILDTASHCGAECMSRPNDLAGDKTPMVPVLQHVCIEAEKKHGTFDYVLLMQPTAPMRTSKHIDDAIEMLVNDSACRSLASVYPVEDCHPSRMYKYHNGTLKKIYPEPKGSLRQDLEQVFHRNGVIYMCERNLLIEEGRLLCDSPAALVMKKIESVNIDDEQDLLVADFLMSTLADGDHSFFE